LLQKLAAQGAQVLPLCPPARRNRRAPARQPRPSARQPAAAERPPASRGRAPARQPRPSARQPAGAERPPDSRGRAPARKPRGARLQPPAAARAAGASGMAAQACEASRRQLRCARGGQAKTGHHAVRARACGVAQGEQAPVALRARWASKNRTPRGARQGLQRGRCGAKAAGRAAIAARAGSQRQGFTSSRQEARRREPLGARCEARKKIHHAMCTQKSAARQMQRGGNGARGDSSACTGGKRHGFTRSHHEAHRPEPLARKACSRESTPHNER
jgi:hypothetical protein